MRSISTLSVSRPVSCIREGCAARGAHSTPPPSTGPSNFSAAERAGPSPHRGPPARVDVVRFTLAMLYFVFGPSAVAVLVPHKIELG